jgi:hypothetical protein
MVLYHGIGLPVLALVGLLLSWRKRPAWTIGMLAWIVVLVDISTTSTIFDIAGRLTLPLQRFAYPFSLAWHGPILPYLALATLALVVAAQRWRWRPEIFPGRVTTAFVMVILVSGCAASPLLVGLVAQRVPFHGALASRNDIAAMRWLFHMTKPSARVLNYPGDYPGQRDWEAHWAPVLSERDSVFFRMQPFFLDRPDAVEASALDSARREQKRMLEFWRHPGDPAHEVLFAQADICYVLIPEAIADPSSLERAWRGQPPAVLDGQRPRSLELNWLRPVYRAGGAAVYRVDLPHCLGE